MITNDRSFPYPVLTPMRDDVHPNDFGLALSVDSDADSYRLQYGFSFSNPVMESVVAAGKATLAVHVECRRNFYRQMHRLAGRTGRIVVPASELVGRVEVVGLVLATQDLNSYLPTGAHADYGTTTFSIAAGDVLACTVTQNFEAYTDYDPLQTISSIMTIRQDREREEGGMKVDLGDDRIVVTLSHRDYERYTDLKADPAMGPLLANQVVIPALMEAIGEIKRLSDDDLELEMSKRWLRSVDRKLKELGVDVRQEQTTPLDAVQALLKLPLRRSLEGLGRINPLEGAE